MEAGPMLEAIREHTGLDFTTILDDEAARQAAQSVNLEVKELLPRRNNQ